MNPSLSSLYQPLDLARSEIRVLKVPPRNGDNFELIKVSLDQKPSFVALSYVWGDINNGRSINIQGRAVSVTQNLEAALTRLRHQLADQSPDSPQHIPYVWADAVCINQEDNIERGHQVQLMARIYKSASYVASWLGPKDHSLAFQAIQALIDAVKRNQPDEALLDETTFLPEWLRHIPRLCRQDPDQAGTRFQNAAWEAIADLLTDPYWDRLWIFQEIALTHQLNLLSTGDSFLAWEGLELACLSLESLYLKIVETNTKKPKFLHAGIWSALTTSHIRWGKIRSLLIARLQVADMRASTGWLLSTQATALKATDHRDYIYGLLSVSGIPITPNYDPRRTLSDLYTDYVLHWLEASRAGSAGFKLGALGFLQIAGIGHFGHSSDFPSWAPNYPKNSQLQTPIGGISIVFTQQDVFPNDSSKSSVLVKETKSLWAWGVDINALLLVSKVLDEPDERLFAFVTDFMSRHRQYIGGISSLQALLRLLTRKLLGPKAEDIAFRLGKLIDQIREACPDAVILVAMIIPTCDPHKEARHKAYVDLIPGVVKKRAELGHHIVAVDFTGIQTSDMYDCLHPDPDGYRKMGDYWYDVLSQIPRSWITKPIGRDPDHAGAGSDKNGGVATDIPKPDYGNPIVVTSKERIREAYEMTMKGDQSKCKSRPTWQSAGKIAMGVGKNGLWKFTENWGKAGKVFDGIGESASNVRFHDMDGNGKADYVWLHPTTGRLECYLNNLPDGFIKAKSQPKDVITAGTTPAERIYIADLNADGLPDYLVVDPENGSVDVWWNKGPSANAPNGWDWAKGGQIAPGALHANLATLRFPDINGDGRADYVFIGKRGSLGHWMNTGTDTGRGVEWVTRHGIATGESYQLSDFSKLVLADIDGDGRDDHLVFDEDSGLSGFLNQPSNREGVPTWMKQAEKSFAKGIKEPHRNIHLADMDGNGKADYIWVDDKGAVNLWHNRGSADTSMAIDGLRFADTNGDGVDDYIWVDPETGAPSVRLNMGPDGNDQLGWGWKALNDGKPIARGTAPGEKIRFADIDGNGRADYIVIDPKDGGMRGWLNGGPSANEYGWNFAEQGRIFKGGIGPGANVRLADVDGDGFDDYIYLHPGGRTTIYRNKWNKASPMDSWVRMESAEAKNGVQRRPEEIHFHDINGDGKADYLWVNPVNGIVKAWINNYPNSPAWVESGEYAGSVGTAGNNIRFAKLHLTGRASLVAVDRSTNAIAAWLNGCDNLDTPEKEHRITITHAKSKFSDKQWSVTERPLEGSIPKDHCDETGKYSRGTQYSPDDPGDAKYPTYIGEIDKLYGRKCVYTGLPDTIGRLRCEGVTGIHCYKDPSFGKKKDCGGWSYTHALYCEW